MCNLGYALLSTPGFDHILKAISYMASPDTTFYKVLVVTARIFGYIFLAHLLYAILTVVYLVLGLRSLKLTLEAIPLVAMSATSFVMLSMLYFFSMAGAPRYTYVMICLCHGSHFFAWKCWKARKSLL